MTSWIAAKLLVTIKKFNSCKTISDHKENLISSFPSTMDWWCEHLTNINPYSNYSVLPTQGNLG